MRDTCQGTTRNHGRLRAIAWRAAVSVLVGVLLCVATVPLGTALREWREARPGLARPLPLEQGSAYVIVDEWQRRAGRPEYALFIVAHVGIMEIHPATWIQAGVPASIREPLLSHDGHYQVFWAGWPWPAAAGWYREDFEQHVVPGEQSRRTSGTGEAIGLRCRLDRWQNVEWAIPVRPVWSGLLANVGVFALAAMALLTTPGCWRRYVRRWEGRCVACGYELGGLPRCPECGREA